MSSSPIWHWTKGFGLYLLLLCHSLTGVICAVWSAVKVTKDRRSAECTGDTLSPLQNSRMSLWIRQSPRSLTWWGKWKVGVASAPSEQFFLFVFLINISKMLNVKVCMSKYKYYMKAFTLNKVKHISCIFLVTSFPVIFEEPELCLHFFLSVCLLSRTVVRFFSLITCETLSVSSSVQL